MNRKLEIESRLERSLRKQVSAPTLDDGFNAAVWARIAAEERGAEIQGLAPMLASRSRMPRWLVAANVLGACTTVVLLVIYAASSGSAGVDLNVDLGFEWPTLSAEQRTKWMSIIGNVITGAAILFGLRFTAMGRRLRAFLR